MKFFCGDIMANSIINKPRGTLDLIGDNYNRYNECIKLLTDEAIKYGYSPIQTPIFEESGLFLRSVGDSSDIVRKQTFDLVNKGSAKDYTLRPEFTAGIVRAVIENKLYSSPDLPLKFVYSGTVYRYERPGTGRLREFRQFGVEVFDVKLDYLTQSEVLILAYKNACKILGHELVLNLNFLGDEQTRNNYKKELVNYFSAYINEMCDDCHERLKLNPLRILDCKVEKDQKIVQNAPILSSFLSKEDKEEFDSILDVLKELNIPYVIDERLVRGLDYYTGIVFEINDPLNEEFGALGGGGKYAGLMAQLGGPNMEGIGFSYGIDRLLGASNTSFVAKKISYDYFLLPIVKNKESINLALSLSKDLRELGFSVVNPTLSKGISGAFKMADRLNCKYVLIINENQSLEIKDLMNRTQRKITKEELLKRGE